MTKNESRGDGDGWLARTAWSSPQTRGERQVKLILVADFAACLPAVSVQSAPEDIVLFDEETYEGARLDSHTDLLVVGT